MSTETRDFVCWPFAGPADPPVVVSAKTHYDAAVSYMMKRLCEMAPTEVARDPSFVVVVDKMTGSSRVEMLRVA